jgi:hypothetical protein
VSKTFKKHKPKKHANLKKGKAKAKNAAKAPLSFHLANDFMIGITKTGRPPIYDDPKEMSNQIEAYFETLTDPEQNIFLQRPTITGLCLFLGFETKQSFYDYEKRPEFSYLVKRARMVIERTYENRLGGTTPTGAIFALKNMGWADTVKQEHSGPDGRPIEEKWDLTVRVIDKAAERAEPDAKH